MPFHNLLVGLSGTEKDLEMIRYASVVSRHCRPKRVNFVHVQAENSSPKKTSPSFDQGMELIRNKVTEHFDHPDLESECFVLRNSPIDGLLEFAATHETDLILVGHAKSTRGIMGRRLAMKAPCSVWIKPEGAPLKIDNLLVPIDFSAPSADALESATMLVSQGKGNGCFALHVYFNEASVTYDEYDEVIRGQEMEAFSKFIAPINLHGIEVKPLFEESANVAHAIERVAESQQIDLVVMGTRGRSRSAAVLLGSETEHVIAESIVPVLAVKHFGARLNLLQAILDKKFLSRGGNRTS